MKSGNFGGSRNMGDHMVEETMVLEAVKEVGVMEEKPILSFFLLAMGRCLAAGN